MSFESILSACLSFLSFFVVLSILIIFERKRNKKITDDTENQLFMAICISIMTINVFGGLNYLIRDLYIPRLGPVMALFFKTIVEIAILHLTYQWLLFVDYKLYFSRDHLLRRYSPYFIPIAVFFFLLIVNTYFGIMFSFGDNQKYDATFLYYAMEIMEYLYFFGSFLVILKYRKNNKQPYFFRILPMVLPVALAEILTQVTDFNITSVGCAVAAIFLYISMRGQMKYRDGETGLYSAEYLKFLERAEDKGRISYPGRLEFRTSDDMEFVKILEDVLPPNSNIIRVEKGRFVFLSENGKKSFLNSIVNLVREAVNEYDIEHPDREPLMIR